MKLFTKCTIALAKFSFFSIYVLNIGDFRIANLFDKF